MNVGLCFPSSTSLAIAEATSLSRHLQKDPEKFAGAFHRGPGVPNGGSPNSTDGVMLWGAAREGDSKVMDGLLL